MRRLALLMLLAAAPALAQTPANKQRLDDLLTALRTAPNEETAAALEGQIKTLWTDQASAAIKLLLSRGAREMGESAGQDALESFDAALDLDPELLEAWRGRAMARLSVGDSLGAVRDIQEVLKREPRDFLAWRDLSRIAEARGDWRGALAAWQKFMELSPHSPGAAERLKDLRRRALGENA